MDNRILFNDDVSTLTDINVAISIIVNLRLKYKELSALYNTNQCTLMDIYKGEPSTEFMAGAGLFIAKRSQSYLSMNW